MALGDLFGGKSKKFDTQALKNILEQGLQRQAGVVRTGFADAAPLSKQFEQKQTQLGQAFEEGSAKRAQDFAQGLQQVESPEFTRQQLAKSQELAFRNLPATQQLVRENLAATGGLNRGAAVRALQQPVLQASRQASDQAFQIQQGADARNIERREQALDTIFQSGQAAALQRLGIDRDTARVLLETGRSDILNRAMQLAGIEEARTQGLLDIEQLRQSQDIAADQARRQRFAGLLQGGLGLAGTGIGLATGGPLGGAIGGQIGSQIGGFAGGGTPPDLSPSLALLALQRRPKTGQSSLLNNNQPFPVR